MRQLHPAVGAQVGGGRRADVAGPVLAGDAVQHLVLAKGGLIGLPHGILGHGAGLLILAVQAGIIKIALAGAGRAVGRLFGPFRRQHGTAAAAVVLAAQGALAAGRAGAQLGFLIRELPFVSGGMSWAVDAAAQFFITIPVVRCAAVGADDDVVLQRQRLAAALAGAAIIFWHNFLP